MASEPDTCAAPDTVARVAQLWRFPVKSMAGERLDRARLTPHGLDGDRLYAFESSGAPPGMLRVSGAERRALLRCRASIQPNPGATPAPRGKAGSDPDGAPDSRQTVVTLPHGPAAIRGDVRPGRHSFPVEDPALLEHLRSLLPGGHDLRLTHAARPQTDCRPLAVISLQTVARLSAELGSALDLRRFRANLILDFASGGPNAQSSGSDPAFPEDSLVGRELCLGDGAVIRVLERDPRCRFITLDPETAEPLPELMRLLHRRHDSRAGVYAAVVQPGEIATGDPVHIKLP